MANVHACSTCNESEGYCLDCYEALPQQESKPMDYHALTRMGEHTAHVAAYEWDAIIDIAF